jgi:hypothetical protein
MSDSRIQLTDSELENLYRFCARHYVHWYDVQAELVDHLATAIEERLAANPKLSFEQALDDVYRGFGYKGFAGVVAERTAQVQRANNKLRRCLFFSYFRWPKMALTLFITTAIYSLGKWLPGQAMEWVALAMVLCVFVWQFVLAWRIGGMAKMGSKKLLLTESAGSGVLWGNIFLQVYVSQRIWGTANQFSDIRLYALIALVTLSVVAMMSYYEYCKALYEKARQQYPAAFA